MSWDRPEVERLDDRLLAQRVVMVTGDLDDARATEAVARLLTLDAESSDEATLRFSAGEGSLDAAFAVYDAVRLMRAPVRVIATGVVGSAPLLVVAGGTGPRLATPSARLLLRAPRTTADPARDVESAARQLAAQRDRWLDLLAGHTGRAETEVRADAERGRWFSAAEAAVYGLVDAVA